MKRLLFTILFCLYFYGIISFITWNIEWGHVNIKDFERLCMILPTIVLANIIYPLIKDK